MNDSPLSVLFWMGASMIAAKFGPLLLTVLR